MNNVTPSRGGLRFTVFGIPTEINPFSWLILGILGLMMFSSYPTPLQPALIFVVVGMLTLLAHELGHALTARAFTKVTPMIIIANLGGVTYTPVRMPTRAKHFLMVLAGPMAGFALGGLIAVIMGVQIGSISSALLYYMIDPLQFIPGIELPDAAAWAVYRAIESGALGHFGFLFYSISFMICFWWTVFNLLPIIPMDGGQLLLTASNNPRLTGGIGLALSALVGIWFLTGGSVFMALMMGYFAWINWQILK